MPDATGEHTRHEAAAAGIIEALKNRRDSFGISQRELGSRSGISAPMISEYESGTVVAPGLPAVMALADALGCDLVLAPRATPDGDLAAAQAEIADLRARLAVAKSTRQWPTGQQMLPALVGTAIQPWHLQAIAAYDEARGETTPVRGHGRYQYTATQINEAIDWWNGRARNEMKAEPDDDAAGGETVSFSFSTTNEVMTAKRLSEIDRRYGSGGGYTGAPTKYELRQVVMELVREVRRSLKATSEGGS